MQPVKRSSRLFRRSTSTAASGIHFREITDADQKRHEARENTLTSVRFDNLRGANRPEGVKVLSARSFVCGADERKPSIVSGRFFLCFSLRFIYGADADQRPEPVTVSGGRSRCGSLRHPDGTPTRIRETGTDAAGRGVSSSGIRDGAGQAVTPPDHGTRSRRFRPQGSGAHRMRT